MTTITLKHGDCVEQMKAMKENSVGEVVTDPPYLIDFMGKKWDGAAEGQMQQWHLRWLQEAFRVLKPGGTIKAFSGTRTMHRLAAAMEDVGFVMDPAESIAAWAFGSGFPKSLNISKALDKMAGELEDEGRAFNMAGTVHNPKIQTTVPSAGYVPPPTVTENAKRFQGFGTAMKPAFEPILCARKPLTPVPSTVMDGSVAKNEVQDD